MLEKHSNEGEALSQRELVETKELAKERAGERTDSMVYTLPIYHISS